MKTTSTRSRRSKRPNGRKLRQKLSKAKLKDAVGIGDDKSYQGYTALLMGGKF